MNIRIHFCIEEFSAFINYKKENTVEKTENKHNSDNRAVSFAYSPFSSGRGGFYHYPYKRRALQPDTLATGRKVDFAFHANGIIRGNITPSTLAENEGNISMFDLCMISGLGSGPDNNPGYPLVSFYLTEAELMNMLEISTLLPLLWGDVFFLQVSGLSYEYDPARAVWFNIPFINKPLPAYRSIINAWKHPGDGIQKSYQLVSLDASSSKLYHVATTHYLATYLPMVGKRLPRLNIVLKNSQGEPVELEQTIIKTNGRELKLWEATARYAASFATSTHVIATIPDYYRQTQNRIVVVKGPSLWFYPCILLFIAITIAGISLFLKRRKA